METINTGEKNERTRTGHNHPQKKLDIKKNLALDSIMILQIGNEDSFVVTMLGLEQDNCDDRVLLSSSQKEIDVIEKCIEENIEFERKSIMSYMPSDYIDIYNEALSIGKYRYCLTMLHGIELYINKIYKEKNEQVSLHKHKL